MTAIFALLAAGGAVGLVFSLWGQGRARREPSFTEALREADGPSQDLARRLELLEEKVRRLEDQRPAPEEDYGGYIAPAPAPRFRAEVPPRPRQPEAGALSRRMRAVWEASEKTRDPLEIARALNMGVSEVELALKVKNMRPEWG